VGETAVEPITYAENAPPPPLVSVRERLQDGDEYRAAEPNDSEASSQVAARLLAEILALDLGNLTPVRALTLLHELQMQAREALPWSEWMADLAGARNRPEPE
jgi:hypothetical protein